MKKVLSVMLAAAMVMGMSVSSFAATDKFFGKADPDAVNHTNVENINWKEVVILDEDGNVKAEKAAGEKYNELAAGDQLFFRVYGMEKALCEDCEDAFNAWHKTSGHTDNCVATREATECDHVAEWNVDPSWIVKVNNEEFVEEIEMYFEDDADELEDGLMLNIPYVKVVIADDFNHYEEDETTNFWFYIYDTEDKQSSNKAQVKYDFEEYREVYLVKDASTCKTVNGKNFHAAYDELFDVDGHFAPVKFDEPCEYILCDCAKCYKTSQNVMFYTDIDGKDVYFQGKMVPGEEYLTTVYVKYDKALTKAYDTVMNVLHIDTEMKVDAIFESGKDDKVVLEVIDGELYEVESEFVTKYEVIKGEILTKGYKVSNIDNGAYVLVDADADLEWEDTTRKEVVEAPAADDKANPSTGANDFVGAAVALAVVSVAAAGALAFKK